MCWGAGYVKNEAEFLVLPQRYLSAELLLRGLFYRLLLLPASAELLLFPPAWRHACSVTREVAQGVPISPSESSTIKPNLSRHLTIAPFLTIAPLLCGVSQQTPLCALIASVGAGNTYVVLACSHSGVYPLCRFDLHLLMACLLLRLLPCASCCEFQNLYIEKSSSAFSISHPREE